MRRVAVIFLILATVASTEGQVLYRVTGKGINESYILCMDYMLPASELVCVKDVFKCYNHSDIVVCEMAMDEEKVKQEMKSVVDLSALIGAENIEMVDSVLNKDLGIRLSQVEKLKPAAVSILWRETICSKLYDNGDEDVGMDSYFQQAAILEGKEVVGLDCSNDVFGGDVSMQARQMVDDMRQGSSRVIERYWQADTLFRRGDLAGLSLLQTARMSEAEKFNSIDMKVELWADRLIELMKKNRCFVVVSAKYAKSEEKDRKGLLDWLDKRHLTVKEYNK